VTVPPKVKVKAGKQVPFRVRVKRQNVEGGVVVRVDGVPPGVTLHDLTIPADQSEGEANVAAGEQAENGDHSVVVRAWCGSVTATPQNTIVRIAHE
jgi:hypothetical protein